MAVGAHGCSPFLIVSLHVGGRNLKMVEVLTVIVRVEGYAELIGIGIAEVVALGKLGHDAVRCRIIQVGGKIDGLVIIDDPDFGSLACRLPHGGGIGDEIACSFC